MVKIIQKVTKKTPTRERRKIIVVGTEGKNKTEEIYFRRLEKEQNKYHFVFANGNDTDPVNIVKNTIKKVKEEELSYKNGDLAFSVFDLDLDQSKVSQLEKARNASLSKGVCLVTSNPSFEIWYLEHFGYTTKPFSDNGELINELKKHIPNYEKNTVEIDTLFPLTNDAIENCKRLRNFHSDLSLTGTIDFCNPQTDVYKIVEIVLGKRGNVDNCVDKPQYIVDNS